MIDDETLMMMKFQGFKSVSPTAILLLFFANKTSFEYPIAFLYKGKLVTIEKDVPIRADNFAVTFGDMKYFMYDMEIIEELL